MGLLDGKVALITGASTGMGRAIAERLAAEGAALGLVARGREKLEEAAARARDLGGPAFSFPGDVSERAFAKRVVDQMVERLGRIDLLVNNAGTNTFHRNLADITEADWRRVMDTNITGVFLFTRYVLRPMRRAGRGQIISISSTAGIAPNAPSGIAYSASKSALHSFTTSVNLEERPHGIRACVIAPGETDTPNLDLRPLPPSAEALAKMLRAEDIANAVLYVASQPEHVSVELLVLTPTVRRNYLADYDRYVAEGHTDVEPD
ncbi:MAG TPA: SDR family NAD(P)-dependent oxidoreductase [Spirochaetia bacterium]|nr:SDR family NAD(P)-dependent oxidoreductase [Spirochaetia bacterium]